MKRLSGFFCLLVFAVTGLAPAATGDARYTHPGRLVNAGSTTLNFNCMGSGSPTVVFDAGWEDWSPAWAIVQPAVARHTRACSYDRAGAGFSSAGPMPRTSVAIASELHAALHAAHVPGPYLLVGHSFGSYNMRTFADLYMPEVYGLVLVDGEFGDVLPAAKRAANDRDYASAVAELQRCRAALVSGRPLPLLPRASRSSAPMRCNQQFFRGLPERLFSPELNTALLTITLTKAALYDEVISEMEQMPADERYLIAHLRSFGNRPVRILTAQNHFYDTAKTPPALHRRHLSVERQIARAQARWLTLSTNAKQIFAYKSGHYIELDQPQIVIDAIVEEIEASR
ncbi:MAG TPA: alpha/beta hydrolase [Candidatus Acidoferrales bacterium]|nr:alpha/beta hydrolase [Candidatus Acidoferrales bacterium]